MMGCRRFGWMRPVLQPSFEDYARGDRIARVGMTTFETGRNGFHPFRGFKAGQPLIEELDRKPAGLVQLTGESLRGVGLRSRGTVHVERQPDDYPRHLKRGETRANKFEVALERTPLDGLDRIDSKTGAVIHGDSDPPSAEINGGNRHY